MRQKVYLYKSPSDKTEYFRERNIELARFFAKISSRDFGGEYDSNSGQQIHDAYWFLHGPITPKEAQLLTISDRNFFGGITNPLYAQKSVFHLPLPDAEILPSDFPMDFVHFLDTLISLK